MNQKRVEAGNSPQHQDAQKASDNSPVAANDSKSDKGTSKMNKFRMLLNIGAVICALLFCWIIAYYASRWMYRHFNWHPSDLFSHLITAVIGLFLWGLIVSLFSRVIRKRQLIFFQQLLEALRRISRGDFQVNVSVPDGPGGPGGNPFEELVKGINDMASNLKNMEDMRQEFISNVSHEIQSPLTSIGGFAKVLKQDDLSSEQRFYYLDIIERESARLSKLSENMLRLAALESDHPPFHPAPYRLDKQLQQLIVLCEPQWFKKKLEVYAEVEPVTIEADADLLTQVWMNVLHNAIKFTPEGGEIKVSLHAESGIAHVIIQDTGIGMEEEDQDHIFERFYKVDRARSRTEGGNGLGLSIIKKIVDIHEGKIGVASSVGAGTTFYIHLPLVLSTGA